MGGDIRTQNYPNLISRCVSLRLNLSRAEFPKSLTAHRSLVNNRANVTLNSLPLSLSLLSLSLPLSSFPLSLFCKIILTLQCFWETGLKSFHDGALRQDLIAQSVDANVKKKHNLILRSTIIMFSNTKTNVQYSSPSC